MRMRPKPSRGPVPGNGPTVTPSLTMAAGRMPALHRCLTLPERAKENKMENEKTNEAQRYADDIAAHLYAWGIAAEYVAALAAGDADDDETGEALDLSEWGPLNGYTADDVAAAADIARGELLECDTVAEAWNTYLENVLAVELTGKHDGTEWTVTGAEVTVTYGGPSCWLEWNGGAGLTVRASWGSDRGSVQVDCDGLCDALAAFAEGVTL